MPTDVVQQPESMPEQVRELARILREEDDFLIASHYNPDGDALGSTAAMGYLLQTLGKRFALYNVTGVPDMFSWIKLPGEMHTALPARLNGKNFSPSWTIVLDSGNEARVGETLEAALVREKTLNIDHHLGNPMYGTVNWVDPDMSSVGEMVALLAKSLDVELSGPLGEAVYLAIVSDTGSFSYGSTSERAMQLCAEIIGNGLDPDAFTDRYQNNWSHGRLRLFSEALHRAVFYCEGRVGMIRITDDLLERTGTTHFDTDGIVNYLRRVDEVRVSAILREEGAGRIKFSLRSKGKKTNVQAVAAALGGGGHRNAAGGSITGTMDDAQKILVGTICEVLGFESGDCG